jgi:cytochrome c2
MKLGEGSGGWAVRGLRHLAYSYCDAQLIALRNAQQGPHERSAATSGATSGRECFVCHEIAVDSTNLLTALCMRIITRNQVMWH